jgi:hypothetical protein
VPKIPGRCSHAILPSRAATRPQSTDYGLFEPVRPLMGRQLTAPAGEWLLQSSPHAVGWTSPKKDSRFFTSAKFAWRTNEKAEPAVKPCDSLHSPRA